MIHQSIKKGIEFINKSQLPNGSFDSYSSKSTKFRNTTVHSSPFFTAIILSCLNSLDSNRDLELIKKKAAKFLLTQKSNNWSFNYWTRGSRDSIEKPYPDDLDVTFCALAAIYGYDQTIISGKVLADAVGLLTLLEAEVGGPYRTWVVSNDSAPAWKDVDCAVNSNIAYFLSLVDVDLPNVNSYVEKSIINNEFISPYYVGNNPVLYFASRFYEGNQNIITEKIEIGKNSLQKALAVSISLNMSSQITKQLDTLVKDIIKDQNKGGWDCLPFVIEGNTKSNKRYAGLPALTTAICLEAIQKYQRAVIKSKTITNSKVVLVSNSVFRNVTNKFNEFSYEVSDSAKPILELISKMDNKNHISLLPYIYRDALSEKKRLPDNLVIKLGTLNLFGWIAYTIFDDFLDGEGEVERLPVANIASRLLFSSLKELSCELEGFEGLSEKFMNDLDCANAWEIMNCRGEKGQSLTPDKFGDLSQLANKSIGTVFGPVALMLSLGYSSRSKEVACTIDFFKHYLIARQLNDDAHDWEKDLKKGQITYVGAKILTISRCKKKLDYNEIYWLEVVSEVCMIIRKHLKKASKRLSQMAFLEGKDFLKRELLAPIEQMCEKTLTDRARTIEFLDSYKLLGT